MYNSNYGWINLNSKERTLNLWLITPLRKVIILRNIFQVEEIWRDCGLDLLWNKCYWTKSLFSIIRRIFRTQSNINDEALCGNSSWLNIINWFHKNLHLRCLFLGSEMSLIIQGFFLLLSFETTTSNFPRIFLMWLEFYLNISSRIFLFNSDRIKFQTCSNLSMRNHNGAGKVTLFFYC